MFVHFNVLITIVSIVDLHECDMLRLLDFLTLLNVIMNYFYSMAVFI